MEMIVISFYLLCHHVSVLCMNGMCKRIASNHLMKTNQENGRKPKNGLFSNGGLGLKEFSLFSVNVSVNENE